MLQLRPERRRGRAGPIGSPRASSTRRISVRHVRRSRGGSSTGGRHVGDHGGRRAATTGQTNAAISAARREHGTVRGRRRHSAGRGPGGRTRRRRPPGRAAEAVGRRSSADRLAHGSSIPARAARMWPVRTHEGRVTSSMSTSGPPDVVSTAGRPRRHRRARAHGSAAALRRGAACAARPAPGPAVEVGVDDRHHDQRQQRRGDQAADDRAGHGRAHLGAGADRERERQHAEDHGQRRHHDGPQARAAGLDRAPRRAAMPSRRAWFAKSTSRIAFLVTSPISMIRPIMLMMLSVSPREQQRHRDAHQRQRQRQHDRERLGERAELRGQDQVDEDDRQEERLQHVLEHDRELLGVAAAHEVVAGRQLRCASWTPVDVGR